MTFLSQMHILIAPNAFKNSISAEKVAEAVRLGLSRSKIKFTFECFPIGDGGDGTANLIIKKNNGDWVTVNVHDPLKRKITSNFGLINEGRTAVIELANASGLRLLSKQQFDPLNATTFGTGEMIRLALDRGVKKIILGIGGSATVDGGIGILQALGVRFLNSVGEILLNYRRIIAELSNIDLSELDKRVFDCELIILCDVRNRLIGPQGASLVFAHQKGANSEEIKELETFLTKFNELVLHQTGKDMKSLDFGGAAGGTAAGLHVYLNAKLVNGIDYFLKLTEFDKALLKANIVITGEGSIDRQTLEGKGPFGVASKAKLRGLPVIGIAGSIPLKEDDELTKYFDVLLSIGNRPISLKTALEETVNNLIRTSSSVGNLLAINQGSQIF